ncbi:MAG TPA: hypothetical protein VET65_13505 [Candidatus Limnocylindrales bacterium]|nr:hypothetical protein [Candidatus Limnocylindrales bacterium]
MDRVGWVLAALVGVLAGIYLLGYGIDILGYLALGMGAGIGCAVTGSFLHDLMSRPRE